MRDRIHWDGGEGGKSGPARARDSPTTAPTAPVGHERKSCVPYWRPVINKKRGKGEEGEGESVNACTPMMTSHTMLITPACGSFSGMANNASLSLSPFPAFRHPTLFHPIDFFLFFVVVVLVRVYWNSGRCKWRRSRGRQSVRVTLDEMQPARQSRPCSSPHGGGASRERTGWRRPWPRSPANDAQRRRRGSSDRDAAVR